MRFKLALLAAGSCLAMSSAAQAQTPQATTEVGEIVVTALPLDRAVDDVTTNVAVLTGSELVHRRQSTLGETLSGVPGVNSDTFGGGASRPVIRGQTAPRVKVLSDGAGLLDASEVSPDHAVTAEPLLLEGIEILRGPSALLYGGGAIGGAVNLIDKRVPKAMPTNGGEGVVELRTGTGDDEKTAVVGLTAGAGNLVYHIEGVKRDTDDYDVPDWEDGVLVGSFNKTTTAALGLSWVGTQGYLGAAYSEQNSRYGIPGHSHEYEDCHPHGSSLHCGGHDHGEDDHDHDHDHEHEHEDEAPPVIDLVSRRLDVRGEIRDPFAGVERIEFRGGYTDYKHDELEEGAVATTFTNEGYDARVELQHAPIAGFRGIIGVQASRSDFAALGEESFIPESETRNLAIFGLEAYETGDWRFEIAARQEWQDAEAVGKPDTEHTPFSISGAAIWRFAPGYAASLSLSRSQRAPSAQELYARGVHLATNTFEIGDATLDEETANVAELTLRKTEGATTFTLSGYHNVYDGYIYGQTLDQFEEFRLIRYTQSDAKFTGLEAEVRHQVTPWLALNGFADYVRGKLDDGGGNLPRIPAARLGARADGNWDRLSASLEYFHVFEQDEIAAFETETPGYDMLNATVSYSIPLERADLELFARGTNLLDELALNHASFIANVAPLRGKNVVLGVRAKF